MFWIQPFVSWNANKFFAQPFYMNNYFSHTPVYKIWIDLIAYTSPRTSFLINEFQYGFVNIVCSREGVVKTYEKGTIKLELIYRQDPASFFCRLSDIQTGIRLDWKKEQPAANPIKYTFADVAAAIDAWLAFLKTEL